MRPLDRSYDRYKEMSTPARQPTTADGILAATRRRLLADGYARLSTRKVAQEAGVPLSQLHYHFGSKGGLVLALLDSENRRRLARQTAMYAQEAPLWNRWEQACDYLEDDLESGYVRVLQEMIAAGWSTPAIGVEARAILKGWYELLTEVAREASQRFGDLGPFSPEEVATLVACAFIGAEALILLGHDRHQIPIRGALRRIGTLIRQFEDQDAKDRAPRKRSARARA
jgi:AcrR family transcriptional regulator